jgi:hypothetical protein
METVENSPADRPAAAQLKPATARQVARLKLGLHRLDGRSSIAIRARQLIAELEGHICGEITPLRRQSIERAALMSVLAADLAARRLNGEAIPLDAVLKAEGVAKRAVKAVLAERPSPSPASHERSLSSLGWAEGAK